MAHRRMARRAMVRPGSGGSGGGGGASPPVQADADIWVDGASGSDTGAGTLASPYLTLAKAQTVASSSFPRICLLNTNGSTSYSTSSTHVSLNDAGTSSQHVTWFGHPYYARPTMLGTYRVQADYQTWRRLYWPTPPTYSSGTGDAVAGQGGTYLNFNTDGMHDFLIEDCWWKENWANAAFFVSLGSTGGTIRFNRCLTYNDGFPSTLHSWDATANAPDHGIYFDGAGGTNIIENCMFLWCRGRGLSVHNALDDAAIVTNLTVRHCLSACNGDDGFTLAGENDDVLFVNNVAVYNRNYGMRGGSGDANYALTGSNNRAIKNLLFGNLPGDTINSSGDGITATGTLTSNPLLVNPETSQARRDPNNAAPGYAINPTIWTGRDWRPQAGSPLLGAADWTDARHKATEDFLGNARPSSGGTIGPYQTAA